MPVSDAQEPRCAVPVAGRIGAAVASGPAVTNPPAGPCSGTALRAARDATLAALAESSSVAGYGAARAALVALPAGSLPMWLPSSRFCLADPETSSCSAASLPS
jgi:hypothetical protein